MMTTKSTSFVTKFVFPAALCAFFVFREQEQISSFFQANPSTATTAARGSGPTKDLNSVETTTEAASQRGEESATTIKASPIQPKEEVNIDSSEISQAATTGVSHEGATTPPLDVVPSEPTHVFFLGDSLLRYSFLEWLDYNHFQRGLKQQQQQQDSQTPAALPPDLLINEKYHDSWTAFFNYTTIYFQPNMKCDCRRSETFSLGYELENRYYANPELNLYATYIQGYGDNTAHGRYHANEAMEKAHISLGDGPQKDESGYAWYYYGQNWDALLQNHAAQLKPRPTSIVLNAGLWPNRGIEKNLRSILQEARKVVGWNKGSSVIWRAMTKCQHCEKAELSYADVAARDWSLRLPGITFQSFPNNLPNLTPGDYFDDKHFAKAWVYHEWNKDLVHGLTTGPSAAKTHRVFILVGAIRTLQWTEESIMRHWIFPLCPPSTCIAHLVTHFSSSDNRPSTKDNDPRGEKAAAVEGDSSSFFQNTPEFFPKGYLIVHPIEFGYNIGSPQEQQAMDMLEEETKTDNRNVAAARMRMFRLGDPRRYSMWFARAWAWRFVQKTILPKYDDAQIDFFAFSRPDFFWMIPVPTVQFFLPENTNRDDDRSVFVHDTYYAHTADTFAMFPNKVVANIYFSMDHLVKQGVLCLGGPKFDQTLVRERLAESNIFPQQGDWCTSEDGIDGWSEVILGRRISIWGLVPRRIPAAGVIMRPPKWPDCFPLHPKFNAANHPKSWVPFLMCDKVRHEMDAQGTTEKMVMDILTNDRPFRLRGWGMGRLNDCLTLQKNETSPEGYSLISRKCRDPPPPTQFFAIEGDDVLVGHEVPGVHIENKPLRIPGIGTKLEMKIDDKEWYKEYCELYSFSSLDPATPEQELLKDVPDE